MGISKISDSDSWDEVYGLCFIISLRTRNAIAATTIGIVARWTMDISESTPFVI